MKAKRSRAELEAALEVFESRYPPETLERRLAIAVEELEVSRAALGELRNRWVLLHRGLCRGCSSTIEALRI
jgi:hypothetical protein